MKDVADREIADLLPWYETGRLDAEDRARVEAALARDPALRSELELVREERAAAVALNEARGAPSRSAAENLFARLDDSPRGRTRFDVVRVLADWLDARRPRTLAFGAAAALVVIAIQAGVITHLASRGGGGVGGYETASAPQLGVPAGPTLLVAFAPTASAAAIQRLLEENGLRVVGGPAAGYFTLAPPRALPETKVEELLLRLRAHRDVIGTAMRQADPD